MPIDIKQQAKCLQDLGVDCLELNYLVQMKMGQEITLYCN